MKGVTLPTETVFVMEMSPIKFGLGAMDEVFTYAASPERHLRAAELLGARVTGLAESERREALPQALIALMRDVGIPSGLAAIGYGERDVPALVAGALEQPRLLVGAPAPSRPATSIGFSEGRCSTGERAGRV